MTKQGLDAAGHLLLAEGHLRKAKEQLDQEPPPKANRDAVGYTVWSIVNARSALRMLDKQKEEPCNRP